MSQQNMKVLWHRKVAEGGQALLVLLDSELLILNDCSFGTGETLVGYSIRFLQLAHRTKSDGHLVRPTHKASDPKHTKLTLPWVSSQRPQRVLGVPTEGPRSQIVYQGNNCS